MNEADSIIMWDPASAVRTSSECWSCHFSNHQAEIRINKIPHIPTTEQKQPSLHHCSIFSPLLGPALIKICFLPWLVSLSVLSPRSGEILNLLQNIQSHIKQFFWQNLSLGAQTAVTRHSSIQAIQRLVKSPLSGFKTLKTVAVIQWWRCLQIGVHCEDTEHHVAAVVSTSILL